MTRTRVRPSGLERERLRRRKQKLERGEDDGRTGSVRQTSTEVASAGASPVWSSDHAASLINAPHTAGGETQDRRQRISCAWCGSPVAVKARGPLPKWCSPTCRHRAWELERAAASGRVAVQVVNRYVFAVPNHTEGWLEVLDALHRQVGRPSLDLESLAVSLNLVQAAIFEREERQRFGRRW